MPVFTNQISSQNTGSTAGNLGFPAIGSVKQYNIISDEFSREALNPTNAVVLYTSTATAGSGTSTISALTGCATVTSAANNDDVTLRTSGLAFSRISDVIDVGRTTIQVDLIFVPNTISNVK